MGKGLISLGKDFVDDLSAVAWVGAQATIGVGFKSVLGKARHIDTAEVWIQFFLDCGERELRKDERDNNPADMMTRPVSRFAISSDKGVILYSRSATRTDGCDRGGVCAAHFSGDSLHLVVCSSIPCVSASILTAVANTSDPQASWLKGKHCHHSVCVCVSV